MSRQPDGEAAASETAAGAEVERLAIAAAGDMRKIRHLALIVHDHMIDEQRITKEMQDALSWLTAELLEIGVRLNESLDALFAAKHERH